VNFSDRPPIFSTISPVFILELLNVTNRPQLQHNQKYQEHRPLRRNGVKIQCSDRWHRCLYCYCFSLLDDTGGTGETTGWRICSDAHTDIVVPLVRLSTPLPRVCRNLAISTQTWIK